MSSASATARSTLILVTLWLGCDPVAPGPDCTDGDACDFVGTSCQKVLDASRGKTGAKTVEVAKLGLDDKFANLVLEKKRAPDERCPASAVEVMTELAEPCGDKADIMIVSETNQLDPDRRGESAEFRAVVAQSCDGDAPHRLQLLVGGGAQRLGPEIDLPTDSTQIMAWDDSAGVFNFYAADVAGGRWEFHGTSRDVIDSFDQKTGKAANACAGCHTAGGAVMKEFDSPWLHWENHGKIGGATEIIKKFPNGRRGDGADMEALAREANAEWAPERLRILRSTKSLQRVLEPLFCTVELDIDTGTDFAKDDFTGLQTHGLLDDLLISTKAAPDKTRRFEIEPAKYKAAIAAAGQRVAEDDGSAVTAGSVGAKTIAGAADTFFKFAFVHRARGERAYVLELLEAKLISADFLQDVLMIDFTNPVLSDVRCGVLRDNAAKLSLDPATATAAKVTAEFIRVLAAKPSRSVAEDAFLASLQAPADAKAHRARVDAFIKACNASVDFEDNLVKVTSVRRDRARQRFRAFQHDAAMPIDKLSSAKKVTAATTLSEACELIK